MLSPAQPPLPLLPLSALRQQCLLGCAPAGLASGCMGGQRTRAARPARCLHPPPPVRRLAAPRPPPRQGTIPDMHASTQLYLDLQRLYRDKAEVGIAQG